MRLLLALVVLACLSACARTGHSRPSTVEGYYWCSTDPDDPVRLWNDGTVAEPRWMIQHLSGQGDGYHALKYSQCRLSDRLVNPFLKSEAGR